MSKGLIAFVIIAAVGLGATLIIEMRRSADMARERSNEILRDFKTIDNSLKESSSRIDSSKLKLINSLSEKYK